MRPQRCLLINPINEENDRIMGYYAATMTPFPPLGLAYLAAVLEQEGWEVQIIDQYAVGHTHAEIVRLAREWRPDVIGCSLLTAAAPAATKLCRQLREALPGTPLVIGNIHATYFGRQWLERELCDAVVHQEGEVTFLELCRRLRDRAEWENIDGMSFLRKGEYVETPRRRQMTGDELEALPYPSWHLLDINYYASHGFTSIRTVMLTVLLARGCPYVCDFCSQNAMTPKVRKRSIENVLDEIEYLNDRFGIQDVAFADAIFPLSKTVGMEFAEKFIARGLHEKIRWYTETRVDLMDDELMETLAASNLRMVMFGIESANEEVLKKNSKPQSLLKADAAIKAGKRYGVVTMGLFIHGLPEDTRDTILQTRQFALDLDPDFAKFNIAVPYPGSPFFESFSQDFTDADFLKFSSWYNPKGQGELIWTPPGMTSKELLHLQHWSMLRFYARPSKVWHYLTTGFLDVPTMMHGGRALLLNVVEQFMLPVMKVVGLVQGLWRKATGRVPAPEAGTAR